MRKDAGMYELFTVIWSVLLLLCWVFGKGIVR